MIERIFAILVNLSWQFALIFALTWLILTIFRIRSASARHAIWLAVVLCPLILLPMNVISSDIVIFRADRPAEDMITDFPFALTPPETPIPAMETAEDSPLEIASVELLTEEEPPKNPIPTIVKITKQPSEGIRSKIAPLLVLAWLLGVGVSFMIVSTGYVRLRKLISRAHRVSDERMLGIFCQLSEEMGLSRNVRLFTSDEAQTPFSIGFAHPCIILPAQMKSSDDRLRMVLIHEMAHLKRFDDLTNLLRRIAGSILFFHPLFHLAARELELSSEQVCDGWAMRLTGSRKDYADCLVELSRSCMGRLPIGFGRSGSSMTKRVKSIFKSEEVFKTMGAKSIVILSVSIPLLIMVVSALRLVDSASAEQSDLNSRIGRFQRCENNAGAGFFWVDTTNGKTWYWSWPDNGFIDNGQPEASEAGEIGTYVPCANNSGGGMFMVKTTTGEAWWVGYKQDWQALKLGRPEATKPGEVGAYVPCEKEPFDDFGGLYVVNTMTGSGWWTPPSNKENRYPTVTLNNADAKPGEIGTYTCHRNKGGAGLYILNTAKGQFWWTDGRDWDRLDKGEAEEEAIGTYALRENEDGAGIFVFNKKTGEGRWATGFGAGVNIEKATKEKQDTSADKVASLLKQLEEAKKRLYEAEEALVEIQERNVLEALIDAGSAKINRLEKFNNQLIEAEIEHQAAEIELESAAKLDPGSISDGRLPDSYKGAEIIGLQKRLQELKTNLDSLSEKYTDEHVEVRALQEKIKRTQVELSEAQTKARYQYIEDQRTLWLERLNKAEVKEDMLRSRVDELSHELRELPRLQMEIERRRREKEVAEKTYMILLEQLNEIRPLSEAPKTSETNAHQQIKLEIKAAASGAAYGDMTLDDQSMSMENLANVLQKYDPEQRRMLVITSDRDAPREQIIKVMDIAKKAGVEKIGFAVAPR